jgi:mono/diheme cytochrome c family protein
MRLEGAPTLSRGRYLFQHLGCWGCHPRDGHGTEAAELREITLQEQAIEAERARLIKAEDEAADSDMSDDALRAFMRASMQKQGQLNTQADQLAIRKGSLARARKEVAPNLKEIRAKLNKDWLPAWLRDPLTFRPSTRMPHFGLTEEQVPAIAAFIWQAAEKKTAPAQPPGDAARGKTTFETRGCLACHTLDGSGGFAADLARVGEKANHDYLVEWIRNPPSWTVMPNLRLEDQEARDIAAFLMQRKTGTVYPLAEYVNDPALFDKGQDLVKHFGCFGCHEIAGMETLSRIGTDLTQEGSKPIERLDFALFTHEAKDEGWYDHKGFFEHKLTEPRVFDKGKVKLDWRDELKMPDFGLAKKPEDRRALITFLLGSVESELPDFYYHQPTGWAKDIEDGWWIVEKYNCVGCHEIVPGQRPEVWDLPQFQDQGRDKAPPSLVGAGARLDADWLVKFLRNPALSNTKLHRNGVRLYLDMRMPTFALSEEEIVKLVRFFNALSQQPTPYPAEELAPLNEDELADARTLFLAAECLKCHVLRDDPRDITPDTKAPSYIVGAERLKSRWMRRWLRDPQLIMPGTVMPSNFQEVDGRWKANVNLPADQLRIPDADHIELLIRYQKAFDEAEAEYLRGRMEAEKASKAKASADAGGAAKS